MDYKQVAKRIRDWEADNQVEFQLYGIDTEYLILDTDHKAYSSWEDGSYSELGFIESYKLRQDELVLSLANLFGHFDVHISLDIIEA